MTEDRAHHVLFEVLRLVAPDVEPVGLDPQAPLRDAADLDSMDFLTMVGLLADALHADIPESDYDHLETVDAAVAYLHARLG